MKPLKLTVVVPCYNESGRLRLPNFISLVATYPDYKVLFVDDGSSDRTPELLQKAASEYPERISVLQLGQNRGKGEAVRRGILEAWKEEPECVAFWDADLATALEMLRPFVETLDQNSNLDMVFGARVKLMGRDIQRSTLRHYLGRVFATCASMVLRLRIYDTQCGAKMFRCSRETAKLFEKPFCSRWIFDVELLARYLYQHPGLKPEDAERKIYEFPLPAWRDVAGTKLKPTDFFRAFLDLFRIARRYR